MPRPQHGRKYSCCGLGGAGFVSERETSGSLNLSRIPGLSKSWTMRARKHVLTILEVYLGKQNLKQRILPPVKHQSAKARLKSSWSKADTMRLISEGLAPTRLAVSRQVDVTVATSLMINRAC